MNLYLVCFDIADDRKRTRAGNLLLEHGQRVQESVFEVMLKDQGQLADLREALVRLLEDETEVRFYRVCADCRQASHRLDGGAIADYPASLIL